MANLLYRLGRFSARRAWILIVGWIAALAIAGGAFLLFGGTLTSSMSIPGTETDRVTTQLDKELNGLGGANGTVVFQTTDDSKFTTAQKSDITALLKDVGTLDGVSGAIDPFATEADRAAQATKISDGQDQIDSAKSQLDAGQAQLDAAVAQAQAAGAYDQAKSQFDAQQATIDDGTAALATQQTQLDDGKRLLDDAAEIRTVSKDDTTATGIVQFDDSLFDLSTETKQGVADELDNASIDGVSINYSSEIAASIDGLIGPGEIIGVILAALVLMIMLRTLVPALLPIVSSLIGVGVGVAGSLAFSGAIEMTSVTPVLGVMLGLAVGIDYTLFIVNRHRRQVLAGMDVHESIGLANGTSGNAVVFAGSTVLVALLALNVTGIPFLGVMGTVGAVCVFVAVLIAVSLTPAFLGLLGTRVLPRKARREIGHEVHANPDIKPMRTVRAVVTTVVAVVALLVIAIPALSMRLGLPDGSAEPTDSTQYIAYKSIADKFGAGQNGPLIVTATLPKAVSDDAVTATEADLADELMGFDDVVAVAPAGVSDDNDFIAFQVVPSDGPSSESTEKLVHDLRDASPLDGDVKLGVAGTASGNIDISEKLSDVLPIYLALVVGLSFIILILVFRSILVPLVATAGYVLSLFGAFGGVTAVYQWGWLSGVFGVHDPGPVLNFAPIIVMGVLFGLAMDYQLFLVSGMREAYAHGMPARTAVMAGFRNGRAVVTAAAIIMIAVFGGFVFSELAMVRPIGFGLAFGVLLDAFVVRMLLIPAVMHLLGKSAWWLPRWLDKILPDVDVEGAALERTHPVDHRPDADEAVGADAATRGSDADAAGVDADADADAVVDGSDADGASPSAGDTVITAEAVPVVVTPSVEAEAVALTAATHGSHAADAPVDEPVAVGDHGGAHIAPPVPAAEDYEEPRPPHRGAHVAD